MCGIVAVVHRRARRDVPAGSDVLGLLDEARAAPSLSASADLVERANALLRGVPGVACILSDSSLAQALDARCAQLERHIASAESDLEASATSIGALEVERTNATLVRLKDAVWAVRRDRLRSARAVRDLAGPAAGHTELEACWAIDVALSALDRLEVRGRDSAGLVVLVRGHGLDMDAPAIRERMQDPLFASMAVRARGGALALAYKAAAEIGEYGDNTAALREAVRGDELLRAAVRSPHARTLVLGHTRWASVGIISQANAHPLDSDETGDSTSPYCVAVLNGDVDNYADLKAAEGMRLPDEITTDAKVIPALVGRRMRGGVSFGDAFAAATAAFEGSVAIAAACADEPGRLALALRGSGQALYVGLAEDTYVVASEPYGLIEQAGPYLRMDGESGQIVVLDDAAAGTVDGIVRRGYDGRSQPVEERELVVPDVTTRDVARTGFQHYLLKEISEAPQSFRKTLRGRIVDGPSGLTVALGPDTLPGALGERVQAGRITRIFVIGQGTAAVAGRGCAEALVTAMRRPAIAVQALTASELSGFHMREDMSDTIVVAISQSGTSADTNRTVDLVRARGALVISIVNRRGSDLTDKSDGVMYTSDGRDFEMAVPSTKAFYAQIAAGVILAFALAERVGDVDEAARDEVLRALRDLPDAMQAVLDRRESIATAARRHAPSRRYWAVVGNGSNRIAAEEVRIKLSELCYKSIACDTTEDKKHIDLSAEPLILVCAAGLQGSNADDVAMEVARFRAHKAAPIVIASEGDERFTAALEVIWVPQCHASLAFVLSAMAGHVFGYEAALAIDEQARPLREARAAVEAMVSRGFGDHAGLLDGLAFSISAAATRFFEGLRAGFYDGHLEASTAVRVASALRYATKVMPLEVYQVEHGRIGTPSTVVEDLTQALTRAIDELTRPIDAIKHQAKTVTVGITRSDETLLRVPLVHETIAAGAPRDRLTYRELRTLAALDPAVEAVTGYTRYRIEASVIDVVDKGGIARDLVSRTESTPVLRGTKRRAAEEREVWVTRGQSDGRPVILVPEVKGVESTGMTLLHVRFRERLDAGTMRSVLQGYKDRFGALRDAVTETEPTFREDLLETISPLELLTEPVYVLARHWG